MKSNLLSFVVIALLGLPAGASTIYVCDQLNVGAAGQVDVDTSASIGASNYVGAYASLAVGEHNQIEQYDNEHGSSIVAGQYNALTGGSGNFVGGAYNYSYFYGGSITSGFYNYNGASGSLVIGYNNSATSWAANAIVAGQFSASPSAKPAHLVIGNGTSSSARQNSFVVYTDGDVEVQGVITCAPGGDIPMFNGN